MNPDLSSGDVNSNDLFVFSAQQPPISNMNVDPTRDLGNISTAKRARAENDSEVNGCRRDVGSFKSKLLGYMERKSGPNVTNKNMNGVLADARIGKSFPEKVGKNVVGKAAAVNGSGSRFDVLNEDVNVGSFEENNGAVSKPLADTSQSNKSVLKDITNQKFNKGVKMNIKKIIRKGETAISGLSYTVGSQGEASCSKSKGGRKGKLQVNESTVQVESDIPDSEVLRQFHKEVSSFEIHTPVSNSTSDTTPGKDVWRNKESFIDETKL
ncbi:hypothetical protein LWI29_038479 [Acer saccharum]|uniref:Uncharacterized protein n=1 Tax=Acer saccharum TaxID=4024 RepID=A0AA39VAQ6_ACESA|nr:hypothetical protein LWI29_038479 [Acer saccharum]